MFVNNLTHSRRNKYGFWNRIQKKKQVIQSSDDDQEKETQLFIDYKFLKEL